MVLSLVSKCSKGIPALCAVYLGITGDPNACGQCPFTRAFREFLLVKRLAIAVAILGILDAILTFLLVRAGLGIEGNILLGTLASTPWLLVIKAAPLGIVILFLRRLAADLRHIKAAKWCFIGLAIFYGLVVAWNGLLAGLLWP
jgi:hypothetical protein